MAQDQEGYFDPAFIWREPSVVTKLYVFLLFAIIILVLVRMFRVWFTMRRYRKSEKNNDGFYIHFLQLHVSSSHQWGGLIFIVWSLYASISILRVCRELQYMFVRDRLNALFFLIPDLMVATNGALLAVLFLYLLRWYGMNQIELLSSPVKHSQSIR